MAKKTAGQEMLESITGEQTPPAGNPVPAASAPPPAAVEPEQPAAGPPSQETTETPVVAETPSQPAGAAPDFLSAMRDAGFADVADEQAARDRLLEAYRQQQQQIADAQRRIAEMEPLAGYGVEHLQRLREGGSQSSAGAAPAQSGAQQGQPKKWWDPPSLDMAAVQRYYKFNPTTGEQEWARETPAAVRAAAEAYTEYVEGWQHKLLSNPPAALEEPMRQVALQVVTELFGGIPPQELPERLDLTGERRLFENLVAEHGSRIFVTSPITNQLDHDRMTPFGESLQKYLIEAGQLGITAPDRKLAYAMKLANADHPVPQAVRTTEQREQHRQDVRRRAAATGVPQRNGSENLETRPQNKNLSPGRELVASLSGLNS